MSWLSRFGFWKTEADREWEFLVWEGFINGDLAPFAEYLKVSANKPLPEQLRKDLIRYIGDGPDVAGYRLKLVRHPLLGKGKKGEDQINRDILNAAMVIVAIEALIENGEQVEASVAMVAEKLNRNRSTIYEIWSCRPDIGNKKFPRNLRVQNIVEKLGPLLNGTPKR